MNFLKTNLIGIICLGCASFGLAQQTSTSSLALKDAIAIALKNNYNIKLSQNNTIITKNNVTPGNAGMLPQVTGNLTSTNSIQNTKQTKSDGSVTDINGANNTNLTYGVNLNWTIFNGFAMFANYQQLKSLNQLSEISTRDTIESTIASLITTYYDMVSEQQQIKALKGQIEISHTQLNYTNDKYNVGRASKLDVLNAQVNLNTDTSALLSQIQQFRSLQIKMNQLMARDLQTEFSVNDTIVIDDKLVLADVINQAHIANPNILSAQINRALAENNLKLVKSTRYPQIGINAGYNLSDSKTPAGFARQQNTNGVSYGLTASINIYNGLEQRRKESNAKIQIDNAILSLNKTNQTIESQINNFYINYYSGLSLIRLEQSNVDIAKKNLEISLEKYKLGNITPLEIREAQKNYLEAQSRFFQDQYATKIAEITLKEITNSINIQ